MAVLESAGVVPRFRLPNYDERLGSFRAHNVMEDLMAMHFHVERHDVTATPEFGDVVVCSCGRQSNHIGILLEGWFWHVPAKGICLPDSWGNWRHRSQAILRFTQVGIRQDPKGLRWRDIKGLADRPA